MSEEKLNVVTLDNGVEYSEVDRLEYDGNIYAFLTNLNQIKDFCIKKVLKDDNGELVVGLDSEEEFNNILSLFVNKYLS